MGTCSNKEKNKKKKCRVPSCTEDHKQHYCRICLCNDSDHLSPQCQEGEQLYHTTNTQNVTSIVKNKFFTSNSGRLGPGLYFTKELTAAKNIGINRQNNDYKNGYTIFKCRVYTGHLVNKKKKIPNETCDWQGKWKEEGYESVEGIHPKWAGNAPFPEICTQNTQRIAFMEIHIIQGEVSEELRTGSSKVFRSSGAISS